jgi:uncharacterized repeat protein (TIGR01451 family)
MTASWHGFSGGRRRTAIRSVIVAAVGAALLTASGASSVAAVADATTTTLTITPPGQQIAGQPVTFDIAVTSASGAIPSGFVAIQSGGPCGFGSPTVTGTLGPAGTATLTASFPAPYAYQFTACYFAPAGSTFSDSDSGYQAYPIVAPAPPGFTKAFGPATVIVGGSTTLTFTITNPNPVQLTGLAFQDVFPAGLVVAAAPAATSTCGGIVTAVAGASSMSLASGWIAPSASCTVSANVTATASGSLVNTAGPISATESGPGLAATATLTVVPPTMITGFTPTQGPVGTVVTITGTGFTGASSVTFAGRPATFTVLSATQIRATVPVGATSGRIAVTAPGGTATSTGVFTVTLGPVITGFSPGSGRPGTLVTLTGSGFGYVTRVTVNGVAAAFSVRSPGLIVATVPAGATTGPIRVTSAFGSAVSPRSFVVLA